MNGINKALCVLLALWQSFTLSTQQQLPYELLQEIRSHQGAVNSIISRTLQGPSKHLAYERLANLSDFYGSRPAGGQSLENAIDYLKTKYELEFGSSNVWTEDVLIPAWRRGAEQLTMLQPRVERLSVLGLGFSIQTNGVLTADAIVVRDFDELAARATQIPGKIVVYNQEYKGYGKTNVYRAYGASQAAKYGAVASLIRSITPYSLNTPHTGGQTYYNESTKIPTASITMEDALMLQRFQDRGQRIQLQLSLNSTQANFTSRNLVAQIPGSTYPQQTVILGGHLDTWDVGNGAMDDGGGCVIAWQVLTLVKELNLRPKRTLRLVLWTAEELGLFGGDAYFYRNKNEVDNVSLVMESDSGTFKPLGIGFTGNETSRAIMREIMALSSSINSTLVGTNGGGPDTRLWTDAGVPSASLITQNDEYFYYHHSEGDRMPVEDPNNLDLCSIAWTTAAYVAANLENMLPREDDPTFFVTTEADVNSSLSLLSNCSHVLAVIWSVIVLFKY